VGVFLRVPREKIAEARERLDLTANVYWGLHTTSSPGEGPNDPDAIVERVIADFALVSKTPIDVIKKRAQKRLMEKYAS
jgi:hypothetical protein